MTFLLLKEVISKGGFMKLALVTRFSVECMWFKFILIIQFAVLLTRDCFHFTPQVELSGEREAAILDLIQESKAGRRLGGEASKRVTIKKLKVSTVQSPTITPELNILSSALIES